MFQGFFALAPCFLYHPNGKQKHEDAPAHNLGNTPLLNLDYLQAKISGLIAAP